MTADLSRALAEVTAERDTLAAALEAVRAFHTRRRHSVYGGMSSTPPHFDLVAHGQTVFLDQCDGCHVDWPCPTAALLTTVDRCPFCDIAAQRDCANAGGCNATVGEPEAAS